MHWILGTLNCLGSLLKCKGWNMLNMSNTPYHIVSDHPCTDDPFYPVILIFKINPEAPLMLNSLKCRWMPSGTTGKRSGGNVEEFFRDLNKTHTYLGKYFSTTARQCNKMKTNCSTDIHLTRDANHTTFITCSQRWPCASNFRRYKVELDTLGPGRNSRWALNPDRGTCFKSFLVCLISLWDGLFIYIMVICN